MANIRVLLVDDSPKFLDALKRVLSSDHRMEIVGQALNGREALEQAARLCPDVVLMDVAMSTMNGFEATRHLKAQSKTPLVIIVTLFDISEYRTEAAAAGADWFISKSSIGTELVPLLRTLFADPRPANVGKQ